MKDASIPLSIAFIQSDGKIVLAGFTADSNFDLDFAMVRYLANGTIDTSFGTNGKVITDFDGSDDQGFSLIQQPDGKLIAGGFSSTYFSQG